MFDTMTFTKVVGGFCGAFLVFLLGGWVAETVYHVGGESHGEEHQVMDELGPPGAKKHGESKNAAQIVPTS